MLNLGNNHKPVLLMGDLNTRTMKLNDIFDNALDKAMPTDLVTKVHAEIPTT